MKPVNLQTIKTRISELEASENHKDWHRLSLKEEFELACLRDLCALLAERDADKKVIAELKRDVDAANARVEAKCAQLCNQDEEIEMLRQQVAESEESKANLAILYDTNLCDMLPGPQYMDPPDGGQVEPLEQVARMVEDYRQRIAELEAICAESYQVVGALADAAGVFETSDAVSKALDNLSEAKLVHEDVLPFAVEARTVSVKLLDCDYAAVQHMSGGSTDYCNGFVDGTQNAIKCFKADLAVAGINLEAEE